jgi:hypothetical protein
LNCAISLNRIHFNASFFDKSWNRKNLRKNHSIFIQHTCDRITRLNRNDFYTLPLTKQIKIMATQFGTSDSNEPILVGMFDNRADAETAYNDLKSMGYDSDDINIVLSEEGHKRHFNTDNDNSNDTELGNKALEGTGKGAAIGGTIGGIAGAIAALGTNLIIPGLGLVVLGPLAAGLAGAGAGGLTGGIIGALVGAGIPKESAETYRTGLDEGNIVITVHPHNLEDATSIQEHWRQLNGHDIVYQ